MAKRPITVWMYTIFVVLGILIAIGLAMGILTSPDIRSTLSPIMFYFTIILSILTLIPQVIFIYLFFMLKRSSLTWLYISFGLSIFILLIAGNFILTLIVAVFGLVVWDYISHKKVDGKLLFK